MADVNKASLWGDEIVLPNEDAKSILSKVKKPKKVAKSKDALNNDNMSMKDKLAIIIQEVYRVLGVFKDTTDVIKSYDQLSDYIDSAIKNGVIVIDTETNKSLDPITCILMGSCLYTPGRNQAYVPTNHKNIDTDKRLDWQVTEEQTKIQFQRLLDSNVKIIYQNAQFDYRVIKCTCGIPLTVYWDTLIATSVLDENELHAGLKAQYIKHIDKSIEKYDIEHLFTIPYEYVPPEVFALYAATDSYMTYRLYEWQLEQFKKPENKGLLEFMFDVEFPVIIPNAEMMLNGVYIDNDFADRLSKKYHKQLDSLLENIEGEVHKYKPMIDKWRLTTDAQKKEVSKDKSGNIQYNKDGTVRYKKSKSEQLPDDINLGSSTQMMILFYDVLKVEPIYKKDTKKGTTTLTIDDDAIQQIYEKTNMPLCKMITDYRHINKMISTYVDKIPSIKNPDTNRVYASFNQYGAATGRFSSSDPNLQNIPSRGDDKVIRCMFTATKEYTTLDVSDSSLTLHESYKVKKPCGFVRVSDILDGDYIYTNDENGHEQLSKIKKIVKNDNYYCIYFY